MLMLCLQSILGWLQAFVGMADHSKASKSLNLSGLSVNQRLNSPRFRFQHNDDHSRLSPDGLEKNILSLTLQQGRLCIANFQTEYFIGEIDAENIARVQSADAEQLIVWSERILSADTAAAAPCVALHPAVVGFTLH